MSISQQHLEDIPKDILRLLWDHYKHKGAKGTGPYFSTKGLEIVKYLNTKHSKKFAPEVISDITTRSNGLLGFVILDALKELGDRGLTESTGQGIADWEGQLSPRGIDECAYLFAPWYLKAWRFSKGDVRTIVVAIITAFVAALVATYIYPQLGIGSR